MNTQMLLQEMRHNIDELIAQNTPLARGLWQQLLTLHPADSAQFFANIDRDHAAQIFKKLPHNVRFAIFEELSTNLKVFLLGILDDQQKSAILRRMPFDELTDLFDELSDEELKKYLTLLSAQDRQQVLTLMKFNPESAGGIMETDVLALIQNFTVEKSIQIIQRLQPRREIHRHIYVTDHDNILVGHIVLEDLVLKHPKARLSSFLHKNDLIISVQEDREEVAKKMIHYGVENVPVVGQNDYFLGAISSETLVDIIEQEASEDVYRISAMTPIKYPYFETSFLRILYERGYILIILLLAQSISSMILKRYEETLAGFLMLFITMITSTGGNSSSQTSAIVIQGITSGDITWSNMQRFLRREFLMALALALLLSIFSFIRVYLLHGEFFGSFAVSVSLFCIVLVSVLLGSGIPLVLKRLNIDPAYAAGPFLATIMDILGLLIYCYLSKLILG